LLTPLLVFRSLAEAQQRNYLFTGLLAMQTMLTAGLCLGAAWAGWGLPGQTLATALAQVPAVLILLWNGVRTYGGIWSASADPGAKKTLWAISRPTFVHGISDRLSLVSDNIVIAWILGPRAVVPFFLTQQLVALAQFHLKGISNATWAGLVELHSQRQNALFQSRLLELTGTVSALAMAVLGPIAAYNQHFITYWVGSGNFAGEPLSIIATVNAWFWSIYSLWGWVVFGTGHIGRWAPYAVVFTMVNVIVSVVATLELGVLGPLLGTLAGFILINAWALPRLLQQVFGISSCTLWRTALAPLPWGLSYAALLWLLARIHRPWGWFGLVLEIGCAAFGGLALWWTLSLNQDARIQWRYRLKSVLGAC
jgi:O-antigen/teichoic acid export membrane protein